MKVTGERTSTASGGFNPTFQRHAAGYGLASRFFTGGGRIIDLGCGVGHSYSLLPAPTVGFDIDRPSLQGQGRPVTQGDIRTLPFREDSFDGVMSAQSIEHVPDPRRVVDEARRVLRPRGVAVFITPNRLTFGRPDEIIDPFHFIEFDPQQLSSLCRESFRDVDVWGIRGTERYAAFDAREHLKLERLLRLDALHLRRLVPLRAKQVLYDRGVTWLRRKSDTLAASITTDDFYLSHEDLDSCLDVVAVCR
ncbi:MAG: class I SAM-dependent methyltransferase [Actinomycetota bacterium]